MLSFWNDTTPKKALTDFVEKVTTKGGKAFIPEAERIAVFDNDGTLWTENPTVIEGLFAFDRMKTMAEKDPTLKEKQPYKAFFERDFKTIHELGKKALVEFVFKSHEAATQTEFNKIAAEWFSQAMHPKFQKKCTDCIYLPQVELLDYLRANGFKTFIVTGGGIEFVRAIAETIYGIPPEQVVGSSAKTEFQLDGKKVKIKRIPELKSFDDREEKVVNINLHIGRRPVLAFGNSDGDLAMMKYVLSGEGPRMAMLLHHDDAQREAAYDKDFKLSPLNEALKVADDWGINVVSMKNDWNKVFAFQ